MRGGPVSILLGCVVLAGCGSSAPTGGPLLDDAALTDGPFVSAHRGGAAYAPENTMLAFINGVRLGVDELEADAQLTADGELVLIHDDTLDRTTDCSGAVIDFTLAALAACDAAYWFSPGQPVTERDDSALHPLRGTGVGIPMVRELLDYAVSLGASAPQLSIEIKSIPGEANFDPLPLEAATKLVALVREYGLEQRVVVQSFWPLAIDLVKTVAPEIRTQFLTTSSFGQTAAQNVGYTIARGHDVAAPNFDAPDFTAEVVQLAHSAGKQVVPYTVDRVGDLEQMAGLGVDGVISNFPACPLSLQGRLAATRMTPAGVPDVPACPQGD